MTDSVEPTLAKRFTVVSQLLAQSLDIKTELEEAAAEVAALWLDWPEDKRTAVAALSGSLAVALVRLAEAEHERALARENLSDEPAATPPPTTVYGVSTGEYSDYRVHGAFVDRADANAVVAALRPGGRGPEVIELPLCAPGDRTSLTTRHRFSATTIINLTSGQVIQDAQPGFVCDDIATVIPTEVRHHSVNVTEPHIMAVHADAASQDAAIKAAADRAADLLAQHHELGGEPQ